MHVYLLVKIYTVCTCIIHVMSTYVLCKSKYISAHKIWPYF